MRISVVPLVAVLAAGILAGGAVGVMVGATTVPQLHACVEKTTLVMRYTSSTTCHTGEKLLTWNVAGVAGAKGTTGAAGAPGAQGPAGPAGGSGSGGVSGLTFYEADLGGQSVLGGATAGSLTLPAGTYLLSWRLVGQTGAGTCGLSAPTDGPVTFAVQTIVTLQCQSSAPRSLGWTSANIYATVATRLPAVQ